jgi:hypothetical protein
MSLKHAASSYKKHDAKLTEQIVAKVRGNLELQTLVLDYISTYEAAALQAQEKGETVAQTMMAKKKQPVLDLTSPENKPLIDPFAVLPRNCCSYKVWGAKLLGELLMWVEPGCLVWLIQPLKIVVQSQILLSKHHCYRNRYCYACLCGCP